MSIRHQNHTFIDPQDCGSQVGYHITTREHTDKKTGKTEYSLSSTVVLADCSRKIDWDFGMDDEEKIDAAISMLKEFRTKYLATVKVVNNLNK